MEEKKLVPKLRFPGFTEPWEQRKLGEIVKIERGGSPRPIDNYITTDADGLNWIKIGDAPEQGRYIVHAAEKIKSLGLSKTRQVEPGDLILSNSMSFGKPYIMGIHGCIHDGWLLIRNNQNIFDLKFLCNLLGTEQLHAQYRRLAAGSAVNNLNKELVSGTNVGAPSKAEQLKIGQFFESIDQYITLHQRKLEHLKLKKKSLLQKLFPKEGEVYPELRFPGFTDPWEQRKGDEIFISVSDKGYPQLPVLSASQELGMVYRDENGIDIHHNKSNEDTYKRVLPGQFVIHLRSFQGGFAYSNVEGITSPAYTVITFKNPELYYGLFWKQVFKSLTFIKHLETITYGIRDGRSISFSDFRSLKLCYPTYGEQKFIGDGLEKTDNLITLHQRKLEHLQLLKKALLQQLFV